MAKNILCLMLYLSLLLIISSTVEQCFFIFILCCALLSSKLLVVSPLLALLFLLVYLGGLMVLLAYFWMFLPLCSAFSLPPVFLLSPLVFVLHWPFCASGSLSQFLVPSSLLLFFGCFLFVSLLVVVFVVNLSEGRFAG